jgi:DnaJ-class molecular chaperone
MVVVVYKCPRCGRRVERGDRFCPHCGVKFAQEETVETEELEKEFTKELVKETARKFVEETFKEGKIEKNEYGYWWVTCGYCGGTGKVKDIYDVEVTCGVCDGNKVVKIGPCYRSEIKRCPKCDGSGRVKEIFGVKVKCDRCEGIGRIILR